MKEIIIDSALRTNGTNENFTVAIPYCSEMKLLEAYIPISFNNIGAGTITFTGTNTGASVVAIPAGRYTPATLSEYIKSQLIAAKPSETYNVGTDLTNRFNINATETFVADFTNFTYLGFSGVQPLSSSITGTSTTSIFHVQYALIGSTDILGYDNGPMVPGRSGILHVVPLCNGSMVDYRSSPEAPWIKIIRGMEYTPIININFNIYTNGQDLNGAGWVAKILIR